MKKEKYKLYDTTLSQDLPILQTKYTLYKRIINITMSATSDTPLYYDLMLKALNLAVERNDCARLRFVKRNGKIKQYFLPKYEYAENNLPPKPNKMSLLQKKLTKPLNI